MFDFDWAEIALVGVVALVAIGPKDLPVAIKTVAGFVKKARKMASEFQGNVDEMVREANLHEVRQQIQELKSFDIKGEIEKTVDGDGSLRSTINDSSLSGVFDPLPETDVATRPDVMIPNPEPAPVLAAIDAPAFVPPEYIPAPSVEPVPEPIPPAFVPPGINKHIV
ncbi:MAG: Sec-independent protein translocase protein TatB [Acetobacteraceae bacterium]|nr:Sec-independent protein translocase protein TatB [Acetobacteraceae bacterium]